MERTQDQILDQYQKVCQFFEAMQHDAFRKKQRGRWEKAWQCAERAGRLFDMLDDQHRRILANRALEQIVITICSGGRSKPR